MKNTWFFEIPDNQEIKAKLVESVPSNWLWVSGWLNAPKELITYGKAEENTGFAIERFHEIHPTIIGNYDQDRKQRKPNLFAIMVEHKLPGFIKFSEAGIGASIITFELAKSVATGFIRKGYHGGLYFYRGHNDNDMSNNPAQCTMTFQPFNGAPYLGEESGEQPARIKVMWESGYGGKIEDITPIISVCRSFNLREYTPQKKTALQT